MFLNHDFFEYDKAIKEQLSGMGHNILSYKYVKLPNHLEMVKCRNEDSVAYRMACSNKQKHILKDIKRKKIYIDAVLVTAGHMLEEDTLIALKEMYPNARFVWYLWDNVASIACYETNRRYFDKIVSFDKIEAKERDMEYLPDFYVYEKKNIRKIYDLSYVGTYRKEREEIIEQLVQSDSLKNNFIYLYQKINYGLLDYLYKVYAKIMRRPDSSKGKDYYDKRLNYRETVDIMAQSRIVLDICYSFQTGLSMRPFEAMATRSKLITTNKNIVKYDFYNPNNIMVIDADNVTAIPDWFVRSKYEDVDDDILSKYSIQAWCKTMMEYLTAEEKDYDGREKMF